MAKTWGWEVRPCKTCTRTKDPINCGNRNCPDWAAWFTKSWDELRKVVLKEAAQNGQEKKLP